MLSGKVQIISAPSILGLRPTGVENLPDALLKAGLRESINAGEPVIQVRTLNDTYSPIRDRVTRCLNTKLIMEFSKKLAKITRPVVQGGSFALTLGGDCSILLGIMLGLKPMGEFGLLFIDAHADFYSAESSTTGEVADMDLAIVCGKGPIELVDIEKLKPYVAEQNVIHIGQRDKEETRRYHSPDIGKTLIRRFDLKTISSLGIDVTIRTLMDHVNTLNVDGFWIHFDTDSLSDELNPAVDYRLPGGLSFTEVEMIAGCLMETGKVVGMTVTCFNPSLDKDGTIARNIADCLGQMLNRVPLPAISH
jgi:arginase